MVNRLVVEKVNTVLGFSFSLTVEPGHCFCLSGESGVGKTLLLRALADLDPHQGEISLGNVQCSKVSPNIWRRLIGFLPAESAWWRYRVADHFVTMPVLFPMLEHLGLSQELLQKPVEQLSSGERQRMAIVRMLSVSPQALLLDEPTANLDEKSKARVETLIIQWMQQQQAPVLWVTHDPSQIKRLAHQHGHLERGALVLYGNY